VSGVHQRRGCLSHQPGLDGLRGVAILLVLQTHLFPTSDLPGWLGVDVFFVLSGYLITTLLLREETIDLRRFYVRRIGRLYPALLAMILLVTPIGIAAGVGHARSGAFALGYVANYYQAIHGDIGPFAHTWSLAVEEQFYLVWPIALLGLLRLGRRLAGVVAAGLAVASFEWLFVSTHRVLDPWWFRTDARGGGLLLGCALALFAPRVGRVVGWLGALLVSGVLAAATLSHGYGMQLYVPVVACGTAAMIVAPPRFLNAPWLSRLGRLSYSLYLWHYPALLMVHDRPLPLRLLALATSAGVAVMCYRFVEVPARRGINGWVDGRSAPRTQGIPVLTAA
jgi:peptidoglycan/LPS O-acetylase OafA/YrhL